MRVTISWTNHNRRYTMDVVEFLKNAGIDVTEAQLRATAKKLLEQNELEQIDPEP